MQTQVVQSKHYPQISNTNKVLDAIVSDLGRFDKYGPASPFYEGVENWIACEQNCTRARARARIHTHNQTPSLLLIAFLLSLRRPRRRRGPCPASPGPRQRRPRAHPGPADLPEPAARDRAVACEERRSGDAVRTARPALEARVPASDTLKWRASNNEIFASYIAGSLSATGFSHGSR